MTDRPVIFSAPMVRALLDGHKTMTRRLLYVERKEKPGRVIGGTMLVGHPPPMVGNWPTSSPHHYWTLTGWQNVQPSDRLWVRENWRPIHSGDPLRGAQYRVDRGTDQTIWRPSIYMPRWASRLTLVVTATKIERLQEISETDAEAEGMPEPFLGDGDPPFTEQAAMISRRRQFRSLWWLLHGRAAWDANPEVVAISFAVHRQNIDTIKEAA